MICYEFTEPIYAVFSNDVPPLLYYSHIPVTITALIVGLVIFANGRSVLLNKLLLSIVLLFSGWTILNLFAWTNINVEFLLTIWPFFGIISVLIAVQSYYFSYVFLNKQDLSKKAKLLLATGTLPAFIFAPTYLNLSGFNVTNCDAFGFEGLLYKNYYIIASLLLTSLTCSLYIRKYRSTVTVGKKQIFLMGVGLSLFLLSFYGLTFFASYLAGIGIFKDSRIEMYGLFGMAGFLVFISTLIVQYKIFNVNLFSSQALVLGLIILTGSQLTLEPNQTSAILTIITILLTIVTGWFLIRGVKREIAHGKEIEKLASSLEKANARLQALDRQKSEFVSIASHQLRSPLAAIRGYTSMLLDGTYGSMTSKATGALDRIHESAKLMAFSIEDFLNVSRIESGNMKYELTDFNLKEQAEHIVDDLRPEAVRAGLILLIKSNITSQGIVHADIGKTQQILHNLINNALKYTQKGTITVFIQEQKKQKKLVVEFIDTGIGMSQETIGELFEKFSRAKNANTVNIKGTGLGLFVAREMARAMGGDITAHSEGEDKGSRFILTLPLVT